MAATLIGQGLALTAGLTYLESKVLPGILPSLFQPSSVLPSLPKAFGLVVGAVAVSGFWLTLYGMKVGSKRKEFMAKAEKDGEKDVEARYSLPNLYVEGTCKRGAFAACGQNVGCTWAALLLAMLCNASCVCCSHAVSVEC